MRTLAPWFQENLLAFAGPDAATRQALYDFVLGALAQLEHAEPRIQPVRQRLANQRDDLLAFAHNLDQALAELAQRYGVPIGTVRALWHWQNQPSPTHAYWQQGTELQRQLRGRFFPLHQELEIGAEHLHRASSLVENLNSRLRSYFFLRRDVGPSYLELLRFFLNHHPYSRVALNPNAVAKRRHNSSPARTILTGWRLLGFQRFRHATA